MNKNLIISMSVTRHMSRFGSGREDICKSADEKLWIPVLGLDRGDSKCNLSMDVLLLENISDRLNSTRKVAINI
jgi:hypothetical protein